jgi:transposase
MLDRLRSLAGHRNADETKRLLAQLEIWQAEVTDLQAEVRELAQERDELRAENAQLRQRVAELERSGKRQAAPFRREKQQKNPQPPGRRPGQGAFNHRPKPPPDTITDTRECRLHNCPHCGGAVQDVSEHEHFEVDIPAVRPVIIRYVTESGYCPGCQKQVNTRHEDQISAATGAAGVVLGPRSKALATDLKHRLGLSYAKIADLMNEVFGLESNRSTWCQADQRLAAQARPVYAGLCAVVRESATVHVDETGWRIGTLSAWLWVFTNQEVTVYTIAKGRGHEVVLDILGRSFTGVLVSDCFTAYDHKALAEWLKQKCLAHLLKDLRRLESEKTRGAVRFARDATRVLRDALALDKQRDTLSPEDYTQQCQQVEARLDRLIHIHRRFTDPDNLRLAKRLRKHRPHLLRFLYREGLDATNNQAERMVRPAVITRKTGGCNRTDTGAEAHAILSSILVTAKQRAIPILDLLIEIQRTDPSPPALFPT